MLRGGGPSVQLLARRLRLFAFDVFFFGTAILVASSFGLRVGSSARQSSVRSASSAAHLGSGAGSQPQGPSFQSAPQLGQRPRQSSLHRGAAGSSNRTASRARRSRSSWSPRRG